MGNYDSHPPRHNSIGDLRHSERTSIYNQGKKSSFLDFIFAKRNVYFTISELRVLVLHGESPIMSYGEGLSKKAYKKALEQKEKASRWLQEEKLAKENQQEVNEK